MQIIMAEPDAVPAAALEALRRAIGDTPRLVLGLPTGRTVVPVYAEMGRQGFRFPSETDIFAADEYCWPEIDHPGTNASFFRAHWPAGFPPVIVPRADAADPNAEIQRHCHAIAGRGGLDLLLLGIGRNGHIGFNEPGSACDSTCRAVPLTEPTRAQVRDVWPAPPVLGMTLGVHEMLAARHVLLLATGQEKREVLHAALTGPRTGDLPASYLQQHSRLTVVCDQEAGALLR